VLDAREANRVIAGQRDASGDDSPGLFVSASASEGIVPGMRVYCCLAADSDGPHTVKGVTLVHDNMSVSYAIDSREGYRAKVVHESMLRIDGLHVAEVIGRHDDTLYRIADYGGRTIAYKSSRGDTMNTGMVALPPKSNLDRLCTLAVSRYVQSNVCEIASF